MQLVISSFSTLADPVALLWAVLLAAVVWALLRRQWSLLVFAFVLLAWVQCTAGSNWVELLMGSLEVPYAPSRTLLPDRIEAVVVLGGSVDYAPQERLGFQAGQSINRILTAVDLVRERRVPVLVLTGGAYTSRGEKRPESEWVSRWLRQWNAVNAETILLPISHDTRQEAMEISKLVRQRGWTRLVVVSSAGHLRRAEAAFHKVGVNPSAWVGCDFQGVDPQSWQWEGLKIPKISRWRALKSWLHEELGWWYYGVRDWR